MTEWERADIDLAFIREFSVGGQNLAMPMSVESRRERIRVEIYRNHRESLPFFDSGMTYAEAYQRRYAKPLELRATSRDSPGRPPHIEQTIADLDEDDDEEGEDDELLG